MTAERPAITDDQLMIGVRAGSLNAFEVLYDRYHERAYRVARSVCRDSGCAETAVEQTFTAIWSARASHEPPRGNVAPWVLTVARYRAIDIAGRTGRATAQHQSSEELVLRGLAELPEPQREVVTLAVYGELTHSEIAAHLELSDDTVKGRICLGLQRLRGEMHR